MDSRALNFSLHILLAILSNRHRDKSRPRLTRAGIAQVTSLILGQSVENLVPNNEGGLSYFDMMAEGPSHYGDVFDALVEAHMSLVPVQLDAGNGFVPYTYNFVGDPASRHTYSTGWKSVPAYGDVPDLFPPKPGYKPWFGVFSDSIGIFLFFYYPEGHDEIIEIPYDGIDLGGYKIYWKHGVPGLVQILQVVYYEWLLRNHLCLNRGCYPNSEDH